MSVINASTCNALQASGCGIDNTPEVQVGYRPVTIAVDQATDTIYVVNSADNTVSVINGAHLATPPEHLKLQLTRRRP